MNAPLEIAEVRRRMAAAREAYEESRARFAPCEDFYEALRLAMTCFIPN